MSIQQESTTVPEFNPSNERVVVTGGSGFIGRRLVPRLLEMGADVTVVDQRPYPDQNVRSVVGDLHQSEVINGAIGSDIASIFHLAAITSVLKSNQDPVGTFNLNVLVTQQLLVRARTMNVSRFVLASTNAVTGNVGHSVINEATVPRPLTLYGGTKAAGEMLLSSYAASYGFAATALRFANVYGPGMAEKDSFVPRLMRAARDKSSVEIYGDGTQRRDLVHVDDIVSGSLLAWQSSDVDLVILGSGESITVNHMLDSARKVTGRTIDAVHIDPKPGEMPAVIVDISKAQTELGYEPKYSFRAGLETVWPEFAPAT